MTSADFGFEWAETESGAEVIDDISVKVPLPTKEDLRFVLQQVIQIKGVTETVLDEIMQERWNGAHSWSHRIDLRQSFVSGNLLEKQGKKFYATKDAFEVFNDPQSYLNS